MKRKLSSEEEEEGRSAKRLKTDDSLIRDDLCFLGTAEAEAYLTQADKVRAVWYTNCNRLTHALDRSLFEAIDRPTHPPTQFCLKWLVFRHPGEQKQVAEFSMDFEDLSAKEWRNINVLSVVSGDLHTTRFLAALPYEVVRGRWYIQASISATGIFNGAAGCIGLIAEYASASKTVTLATYEPKDVSTFGVFLCQDEDDVKEKIALFKDQQGRRSKPKTTAIGTLQCVGWGI